MMLTAFYGSSRRGTARGRTAQLIMPLVAAALALCLVLAAKNGDVSRLTPSADMSGLAYAAVLAGFMFFPLEFVLIADMDNSEGNAAFEAVLISGLLLTAAAAIWQTRFNYVSDFPILDLTYNGDFSAVLVRHRESLLLTVLIAAQYFALNSFIYCTAVSFEKIVDIKGTVPAAAILVFVMSLLPDSADTAKRVFFMTMLVGDGVFMVLLPVVLRLKKVINK